MDAPAFVAFVDLIRVKAESNYIGAALVTDYLGVPAEFRCTHPVKPTEIQRQLYGSTLERHIGVELCGKPLLKSLQNSPALVIVKNEILLSLREISSPPVYFIRKVGEVLRVEDGAKEKKTEIKIGSISVQVSQQFSDDLQIVSELLGRLEPLDPVEPFDRISRAVDALAKQDARFQ